MLLFWGSFVVPTAHAQNAYEDAYAKANNLILDGSWQAAHQSLSAFLKAHPTGKRTDDAGFYFCYASEKMNRTEKGVFECFDKFIQANPNSSYVDDAQSSMVRLGNN